MGRGEKYMDDDGKAMESDAGARVDDNGTREKEEKTSNAGNAMKRRGVGQW